MKLLILVAALLVSGFAIADDAVCSKNKVGSPTTIEPVYMYEIAATKTTDGITGDLYRISTPAFMGVSIPVSSQKQVAYISAVDIKADGTHVLTPGLISTGFSAVICPVANDATSGAVKTSIDVSLSSLNSIKTMSTDLQLLDVDELRSAQTVLLTPGGKPVVMATGPKGISIAVALIK